jgi:hypothetical protein
VDPASFAVIGSAVGSASARLQGQQVPALRTLLLLLQQVSSLVQRSADDYQNADRAVAASYSGGPVAPRPGPQIWSSAGAALAGQAIRDSEAGGSPTPHRAESIIGYLAGAGLGEPDGSGQGRRLVPVPNGSAHDLTAWLADSPAHQAQLGLIAVYTGAARGLDGTPDVLHPGDVVFIEPGPDAADQEITIGVVGDDGGLHNHGRLSPDFGGVAQVHVYRPVGGPGEAVAMMTDQEAHE